MKELPVSGHGAGGHLSAQSVKTPQGLSSIGGEGLGIVAGGKDGDFVILAGCTGTGPGGVLSRRVSRAICRARQGIDGLGILKVVLQDEPVAQQRWRRGVAHKYLGDGS